MHVTDMSTVLFRLNFCRVWNPTARSRLIHSFWTVSHICEGNRCCCFPCIRSPDQNDTSRYESDGYWPSYQQYAILFATMMTLPVMTSQELRYCVYSILVAGSRSMCMWCVMLGFWWVVVKPCTMVLAPCWLLTSDINAFQLFFKLFDMPCGRQVHGSSMS